LLFDFSALLFSTQRTFMKRRQFHQLAATSLAAVSLPALAAFPDKPVRIVVPFPAGGPVDVITRAVAERMGAELKISVVVENRPGAAGQLGSDVVAKAPADGYTLLMGSTSTHSLPSLLGQRLNYNPISSFTPLGLVGLSPTVLCVSTKLPVTDLKSFLAYAKSNPGKLSYASSGNGTLNHLVTESFKMDTGVFAVHIPYRGTGQAMTDLISGQVDMMFDAPVTATPQIQANRIRPIAVAGPRRLRSLPNVPTLRESGVKDFDGSLWLGLFAPANLPADVASALNTALNAALATPALRDRLTGFGFETNPGPPALLSAYMKAVEIGWSRVVKARNIKADA
jgi:tripartite-type tricarboxylate transporter receptor subunit TctC